MPSTTPYFAQWESPQLVSRFLQTPSAAASDPLWQNSGASSQIEYVQWSRHLCGMACLKMLLAAAGNTTYTTFQLKQLALQDGAYIQTGEEIQGLIYAPFLKMIKQHFNFDGHIFTDARAVDLPAIYRQADFVMVSVHPTIRTPEQTPFAKGGHLVLLTAAEVEKGITFHNPSGDSLATQVNVNLGVDIFDQFFAGRGMAITVNTA